MEIYVRVKECPGLISDGGCSAAHWLHVDQLPVQALPDLSISDAQTIGASIAVLLALVWGIKQIGRLINQS